MSEKTFKIVGDDISDGYHTFDELYEHGFKDGFNYALSRVDADAEIDRLVAIRRDLGFEEEEE